MRNMKTKMLPKSVLRYMKSFTVLLLSLALTLLTTARAKPTVTFSLPTSLASIPAFSNFVERKQAESMKTYSGRRVDENSLRMIYFNDQAIAIVELGADKLLISCEVIEVYNDAEGNELLKTLSKINRPLEVSFREMLKLMTQCNMVDKENDIESKVVTDKADSETNSDHQATKRGIFSTNPFSLFSGIIPGTKWCGTGDIAQNYFDLGLETNMDRCCRTHDLCPAKIRAYQKRYELINDSLYTKSHCSCDDQFFSCLKTTNTSAAQVMGSIYFNIVQVPCIEDSKNGMTYRKARQGF